MEFLILVIYQDILPGLRVEITIMAHIYNPVGPLAWLNNKVAKFGYTFENIAQIRAFLANKETKIAEITKSSLAQIENR